MEKQIELPTPYSNNPDKDTLNWQERMLPVMKRMIIFLTLFFFLASFGQLIYLQISINTAPKIDITKPFSLLQVADKITIEERQSIVKLEAILLLESNTMERRHHQANVLLMSSIWVRYLGFVTGMILALIGTIFILGKMEERNASEISGKIQQGEANLKSSSPGVIMVVLGSILMIVTIVMQHTIHVNDAPVYVEEGGNSPAIFDPQKKPVINMPKEPDSSNQKTFITK